MIHIETIIDITSLVYSFPNIFGIVQLFLTIQHLRKFFIIFQKKS